MSEHAEYNIFSGREICVVGTVALSWPQKQIDFVKRELENLIIKHGGQVTQHPSVFSCYETLC